MTRASSLLGLALLAASTGHPALAQTAATPDPLAPRFQPGLSGGHGRDAFIGAHDSDGDGRVTREEMLRLREARFAEADSNADGALDAAEYAAEFEARLKADYAAQNREPDAFYAYSMEQALDRFSLLDQNRDGSMSREEYMTSAERAFGAADANGDGVVSPEDPARGAGGAERRPEPLRRAAIEALDAAFSAPPAAFSGRLKVENAAGGPILPGATVAFSGAGLTAGQKLTLTRGAVRLNPDGPLTVDAQGAFAFRLTLPQNAAVGLHEIAVLGEAPVAAATLALKISPDVPLSGAELFDVAAKTLAPGLYQIAYSPSRDALFVSSAAFGGRGAAPSSKILKVDPQSLEILAEASAPPSPPPADPSKASPTASWPIGVFGLGIDEKHGRVWATNTIQNTVAVYAQDDLALVKQFEPGLIRHAREIVVDEARGRAYASGSASNEVGVFDVEALAPLETIRIVSGKRGEEFTAMGLALDSAGGRLFVVSRTSAEVAEIDLAKGEVARVLPIPGADNPAGLAYDAARDRLLIASQASDDLIALDAGSGELVFRTPVGAGALSVAVEPVSGEAYVSNRGAGTITVVGPDGAILANLAGGSYPNHALADGKGAVYAVNKALGPEDPQGDRIARIARRKAE